MVKVRIPWAQIFFGLVIPSFLSLGYMFIIKIFVFDSIYYVNHNFFSALVPTILLVAAGLLFGYFPLTGFLGGWDPTNLEEFRKVAKMSGPSKILVIPIFFLINIACKHSRLHGRFEMPVEGVVQEAKELLAIKLDNREELKKKLAVN
jgi:hypothetical protein